MHANSIVSSETMSIAMPFPHRRPLSSYFAQSPLRNHSPETTPSRSPAPPENRYSGIYTGLSNKYKCNSSEVDQLYYSNGQWKDNNGVLMVDDNESKLMIDGDKYGDEYDDDNDEHKGLPCRFYVLCFMVLFFVFFLIFALILNGASHHHHPIITMKSIVFDNFFIQAGLDATGVPTDLGTLNSTIKMEFINIAGFFGVHVATTAINIYHQLAIMATGNVDNFYQPRSSHRNITVMVYGNQIPLYGGGTDLSSNADAQNHPVSLTIAFNVQSQAFVLGKLVKPKFNNNVQCFVELDQTKLRSLIHFNDTMCQYF